MSIQKSENKHENNEEKSVVTEAIKKYKKIPGANLPNTKDYSKKFKETFNKVRDDHHKDYIIKMNYNENKFGSYPSISRDIKMEKPNIYPEYETNELFDIFSKEFKIDKKNLYFSNGSDSILIHLPKIFCSGKQAKAIVPDLTYKTVQNTCEILGIKIKSIKLTKDYKIDLDEMCKQYDENTKLIYLVNPNMPTGTFYKSEDITRFIENINEKAKKNERHSKPIIVIDEAYIEYASTSIKETFASDIDIIQNFDNVVITRTFSKLFGLASFRIGYCIANEEIISLIKKTSQFLPISKYSIEAAVKALSVKGIDYYSKIIEKTINEKKFLINKFNEIKQLNIGLIDTVCESFGNFIFIVLSKEDWINNDIYDFLLKKYGILIRSIDKKYMRITIGTRYENELLIKGINEWIETEWNIDE